MIKSGSGRVYQGYICKGGWWWWIIVKPESVAIIEQYLHKIYFRNYFMIKIFYLFSRTFQFSETNITTLKAISIQNEKCMTI